MIRIPTNLTISAIEQLYAELAFQSKEYTVDLCLPSKIESLDFAIVPALILFSATWIRNKNAGALIINLSKPDEEIEDFIGQDFAFPIVIMAWKRGIYLIDRKTDIRKALKIFTKKIHNDMRSLEEVRRNRLLLTCFDHLSEREGLLDCFYSGDSFIRYEDVLNFSLVPSLLKALAFNRDAFKKNVTPIMDDIIGIIFELMKNTDEWARTDRNNKPLNPNIRGLFIKFVKGRKVRFIDNYRDNEGVRSYFNDIGTNDLDEQYFAEISVFDSGVGFVNRIPNTPSYLNLEAKVEIVKKCLLKRHTAAEGLSRHGKGLGLDRILNILNSKGLLWIRTDSLSLFRNLKTNVYIPDEKNLNVELFDWERNSSVSFTNHQPVAGSILTIIYPIL